MNTPPISVALPVYNGADYLTAALDSILAQDFADFELVISDNCSTDRTPDILLEYSRKDSRIRVSRAAEFLSQVANVNRAVNLCSGQWIKIFCHDDLMRPDCLSQLRRAIVESDDDSVGLIGNGDGWLFANGQYYTNLPAGQNDVYRWRGQDFLRRHLLGSASVGLPALTSAMVKKEAWRSTTGFDERFSHFDVFFWTRLLMTWDYAFVPAALTTTRIHYAQVAVSTRKSLRSVRDYQLFYREILPPLLAGLNLGAWARAKINLRPMAVGATLVAVEILKGNLTVALQVFVRMPFIWWILLPPFIFRSFVRESKRISELRKHVPVALIYP